jgi:hypothetical protein
MLGKKEKGCYSQPEALNTSRNAEHHRPSSLSACLPQAGYPVFPDSRLQHSGVIIIFETASLYFGMSEFLNQKDFRHGKNDKNIRPIIMHPYYIERIG